MQKGHQNPSVRRLRRSTFGVGLLAAFTAAAVSCSSNNTANPIAGNGGTGGTTPTSHTKTTTTGGSGGATQSSQTTQSQSSQTTQSQSADAGDAGSIVHVQLLAFNDFHGNLRPPSPSNAVVYAKSSDPVAIAAGDAGTHIPIKGSDAGAYEVAISAGGAAYFAAHLNTLRAANPNTLVVSAGDLTGASPLISSLYNDEPTIQVMNAMGVDVHGVGNHEFDHGPAQLERFQSGGCDSTLVVHTDAGVFGSCQADPTFPGANFPYLAANVDVGAPTDGGQAKTLFPPYVIKQVGGAKIALIGMTLQGTPTIVSSVDTVGLTFTNEVATANALVPVLKAQNVDAIVVLLHQGGFQDGTYNDCVNINGIGTPATGSIATVADTFDPAISVVHSAHTHVAYNCSLPSGRILTSAASYGRIITQINLTIDTGAHTVTSKSATNVAVTRDVTPDPTIQSMVNRYAADVANVADVQVGTISADILKSTGANGESALGDVIADALLAYAKANGYPTVSAAFINAGGIRDSLLYKHYYSEPDGDITYEKAQAVQPFGDKVVVMQCTGAQILSAIQQNVFAGSGQKLLQVSNGFNYSWSSTAADTNGQNAAAAASFMINGVALDTTANYQVATVDFVQTGGDGYTAFKGCTLLATLGVDLAAFTTYLSANQSPPLGPPPANRITKTN